MRQRWIVLFICWSISLLSCETDDFLQEPSLSQRDSISDAWIELGRHLFYDRRLSLNNDRSCGICHEQAKGFTDGFVRAVGTTEAIHPRNTISLINVNTRLSLGWIEQQQSHLESQLLIPLLGSQPVEMGASEILLSRLSDMNSDETYQYLLQDLNLTQLTIDHLSKAIASFERTILSHQSPYDQYLDGQVEALSAAAKRGLILFTEVLPCQNCHGGKEFDQPSVDVSSQYGQRHAWYNTGLYHIGDGRYPEGREGVYELTGLMSDIGLYRVPTLRNLAFTGPYYHDGSGASIEDVLINYNAGGRVTISGPYVGDGRQHPNKHRFIRPLGLSNEELKDLKAFLMALSDESIVNQARLSDPWPRD